MKRFDDLNENDILTMEVQLRREGTLPPADQALLLEALRHHMATVAAYENEVDDLEELTRLKTERDELEGEVAVLQSRIERIQRITEED